MVILFYFSCFFFSKHLLEQYINEQTYHVSLIYIVPNCFDNYLKTATFLIYFHLLCFSNSTNISCKTFRINLNSASSNFFFLSLLKIKINFVDCHAPIRSFFISNLRWTIFLVSIEW